MRDQKRHKYHWPIAGAVMYKDTTRWNTNNCILDLQRKISIRNAWRHYHSAVSFIYSMRSRAVCKGTSEEHVKQENDGVRFCNAEKDLRKVNSPFLMHSELSGLWILANFMYVIFFQVLKKLLRNARLNLLLFLFKQNPYAWYFGSYARPLKICEVCNFGAITGSLFER